jgi:1-deoxy-D-xylulose-5-phosphate synthase
MVVESYEAANQLRSRGIEATVVNARFAKPLDVDLLARLSRNHHTLVTVEEGVLPGGFGSGVLEEIAGQGIRFQKIRRLGVPDRFITFGSRKQLLKECGLDAAGIAETVDSLCEKRSAVSGQLKAEKQRAEC